MTFTSSGTVADHLVLHPALATGNFIIKVSFLCVQLSFKTIMWDSHLRSVTVIDEASGFQPFSYCRLLSHLMGQLVKQDEQQ